MSYTTQGEPKSVMDETRNVQEKRGEMWGQMREEVIGNGKQRKGIKQKQRGSVSNTENQY